MNSKPNSCQFLKKIEIIPIEYGNTHQEMWKEIGFFRYLEKWEQKKDFSGFLRYSIPSSNSQKWPNKETIKIQKITKRGSNKRKYLNLYLLVKSIPAQKQLIQRKIVHFLDIILLDDCSVPLLLKDISLYKFYKLF